MAAFVTTVPLRWTDQDAYRHLNHAKAITLLEEARIALFFDTATADGVDGFARGLLVAGLGVDYRHQIRYRSGTLRVAMWVQDVRAASFRIGYEMHDGADASDPVAVTAHTDMAIYDMSAGRPRRLVGEEREFLKRWLR